MSLGSKLQVLVVFAFGLIAIPISIVHLSYVHVVVSSTDPQLKITNTLVAQQAMLTWAIISAIIPNMKRLLNALSMTLGVRIAPSLGEETAGRSGSGTSEAFALQTIGSQPAKRRHARSQTQQDGLVSLASIYRGDDVGYESTVEYTGVTSKPIDDYHAFSETSSQDMIIRKDVQWRVSRDPSPCDHSVRH